MGFIGGGGSHESCPECLQTGSKEQIRSHLIQVHGWTEERVDSHFGDGQSNGPMFDADADREQASDESDLCDCDPEYKESQVISKSAGMNVGPVGGNRGDGVPIIICNNCGQQFETTGDTDSFGSGYFSDGDGFSPL